jgi:6-phosphogluconolactonase
LALSGGSTPKRLYQAMAQSPLFDWTRIEMFFGDERAWPPDHAESNYRMAKEAFAGVNVQLHRMEAERGDAAGYQRLLRSRLPSGADGVPVFDLVLLGMGPDGHTASLFPDSPELEEKALSVTMTAEPHLGVRRMTITLPVINAAKKVWILAAGAEKADMVARVKGLEGPLPIQRVRPTSGELRWWLDAPAASMLTQ